MFKLKTIPALHLVSTVCLMLLIPINGHAGDLTLGKASSVAPITGYSIVDDSDSTRFNPDDDDIVKDIICNSSLYSFFCQWFKTTEIFSQNRMLINGKEYKVVKTEGMTMMTDDAGNYIFVRPNIKQTKVGVEVEYDVVTNETRERFAYSLHDKPRKDEVLFIKEIEEDMADYLQVSLGGSDPGILGPKFDECNKEWIWVPFFGTVGCFLANAHFVEDD